jgi:prolyl-tRNA synthetase
MFAAASYDEFKERVQQGFVGVYWAGTSADEDQIKSDTKATVRVLPFAQPDTEGVCFYTGQRTKQQAIFARSY